MPSHPVTLAARLSLTITVGAILYLATTPDPPPDLARISDKLSHLFAFGVVSFLADLSLPARRFDVPKAAAVFAFGMAIEAIQHFLPWRDASVLDLVADAAGIALYAVAAPFVTKLPLLRAGRP